MLQAQTVTGSTYALLKRLMSDTHLDGFSLAGGTNLALQLGHRLSADLDLFSLQAFDGSVLAEHLSKQYAFEPQMVRVSGTVKGSIDGVKVDIISHKYSLLKNIVVEDGIRLYDLEDIIAMKLEAISDNGTRLKDFVDVAFLSQKFSLRKMVHFYTGKYNAEPMRAYRGISYFDDIDFSAQIELTNGRKFSWNKIRNRILDMVKYENKIFNREPI